MLFIYQSNQRRYRFVTAHLMLTVLVASNTHISGVGGMPHVLCQMYITYAGCRFITLSGSVVYVRLAWHACLRLRAEIIETELDGGTRQDAD